MRRLYLLSLLLSIMFFEARSQNTWTPPYPVTDSLTDNKNATILPDFFPMPGSSDSLFMAWEKSTDSTSTAIWCRNLMPPGQPFCLLSQPGVHFRNPCIAQGSSGDTLFYLFYETDINGNEDLYYIKYLKNGTVSDPVPVRNTAANETGLKYSTAQPGIVWEEDGKIVYQPYCLPGCYPVTGDTIVLDRGDCHHPVLNDNFCVWEKKSGSETFIYYTNYDYYYKHWSSPTLLVDSGINTHLFVSTSEIAWDRVLVWQSFTGNYWRIHGYDLGYPGPLTPPDFEASNNTQPVYFTIPIVVDYPWPDYLTFYSFVSDTTGNDEVYMNYNQGDPYYTNFSENPGGADEHPNFFITGLYNPFAMTLFLTWESFRNGHWQIWATTTDFYMGIDEKNNKKELLRAYPNPAYGEVTFEYVQENTQGGYCRILSSSGKVERAFPLDTKTPGKHQFQFNGKDDAGNDLPAGMYLCIITLDHSTLQKKFILY